MKFKKTHKDAQTPTQADDGSAGWDLRAAHGVIIRPGQVVKVDTGIAVELPEGTFAAVCSRSGLAFQGIWVANAPGIVDSSYRGTIGVLLYCSNETGYTVKQGDKIAQLVIQPYLTPTWEEVEELSQTVRGDGGFGSTGK